MSKSNTKSDPTSKDYAEKVRNKANENTPFDPHSPYSTSKTAAVMFGKTYYEAYGVPVINVSCGNAIGPNQFPEKLVPLTIDRLVNKQPKGC